MKAKELREKNPSELKQLFQKLRKELLEARFQKATAQLKDTTRITKLRRDIARVLTISREKTQ